MAGSRERLIAAVAVGLAAASPALAASPAEGTWRTPTRDGRVELYACGAALCGRLVTSAGIAENPALADAQNRDPALRSRPLKGLVMLQGFTGGPLEWKGGSVYNPEDGGTYRGTIKLVGPDTLKLTGCIVFPLCKTQTWTRVK